jgi:hypothetical protein
VIPAIYALVKGWGLPVSSRRAAVALSGAPAQ